MTGREKQCYLSQLVAVWHLWVFSRFCQCNDFGGSPGFGHPFSCISLV